MDSGNPPAEEARVPRERPWIARLWGILAEPRAEWAVIETEEDTIRGLMVRWVAPLAAVGPVAKLVGSQLFGRNQYGADMRPPIQTALTEAAVTWLLTLAGVWLLARMISGLAVYFGGRGHRTQAMKVAAYGGTAAFLSGGFALVPRLEWFEALGLYSLYLIFAGLPTLMHVTRRKALVFTVVTLLATIGLTIALTIAVILSKDSFTPEFPDAAYNYTPP
ncbi:YIP1 family protein [Sphingomonas sp. LB-2]|uniref:Yip1 family protein n=1 Tax=Sphingomonas caeni TaxID=2984949 RepID=UPI00222F814B|nr:Yip1 family protein [Sphingomonas caeni]MCW3848577.1 YIP1 family protein [Sphingomonas caeni]